MTDLQRERAQRSAPVEAWDAIAALYDKHVAPGEADLATAGLDWPDCRRATRSSTSPLGPAAWYPSRTARREC